MRTSRNIEKPGHDTRKKRVFVRYMQEKLAITVILITLALFALFFVIYRIVHQNQDSYNQIVLSQQEYDSRVIPYRRGDIVDRNGTYLATTEKVYNLIIDPKVIMSDEDNFLEPTVSALAQAFGFDAATLRAEISSRPELAYFRYPDGRRLSYDQKSAFEQLQSDTNSSYAREGVQSRIRGVWFEDEYRRIYPNNSLACNVIGFATSDGAGGNGGIEQYYNDELIGTNGREYGYLNDDSNLERVIKSAVNGDTVVSTIDVNIQSVVEKYINQWQAEVGSDNVGVVVMNPNNGEVLAMSSSKMFDLNNPRSVSDKYTDEQIMAAGRKEAVNVYKNEHRNSDGATITVDQVSENFSEADIRSYGLQVIWNQEWRNFCVSDTYEPGSPSKIFTVASALEEGVINGNETFECGGVLEVGGWPIKCVNRSGHGPLTVQESLMQSCNVVMMRISAMTGRERFSRYMQSFGFGSKTGIDLPGEADTSTLVYHAEDMKPSDLATNSFGQNYNCTMVQMAAAYCSIINGGSYYEPHVVKQILNDQGAVVKKIEPKLVRETVSENTSNFIKEALFRTVEQGTGKAAAVAGYEIAGKTGTAEKYPRSAKNYLVSFCGFAPAYDPEVLVYVTIDVPHTPDQPHSSYASGIFSKIMAEILPYMNIFPAGAQTATAEGLNLPAQEGIADNTGETETQETPEETKVYETDEYVDPSAAAEDSGIPASDILENATEPEIVVDPGSVDEIPEGTVVDSSVEVKPEDNWEAESSRAAEESASAEAEETPEETEEIVIE